MTTLFRKIRLSVLVASGFCAWEAASGLMSERNVLAGTISSNPATTTTASPSATGVSPVPNAPGATGVSPGATAGLPSSALSSPSLRTSKPDTIGVTDNHPFWSVDRQEFLPIGQMEIGERVQTFHGAGCRVPLACRQCFPNSACDFNHRVTIIEAPERFNWSHEMTSIPEPHRKRIKHYHEPGDLHELTFSTYRRKPLLTNDTWRRWLAESINGACQKQMCRLVAFVFMPDHVHLLIIPENPDPKTISRFLSTVKRPVSVRVKQALEQSGSSLLQSLTIRERPGKMAFRFWQEGPGYDRNLNEERTVLASINYIHENPVKRGLCQKASDWKWSSARWYESDRQIIDPDVPTIYGLPPEFFVRDSQTRQRSDE